MSAKLTPLPNISQLSERVISILGCNPSRLSLLGTNSYLVGTGKERLLVDTSNPNVTEYQNLLQKVLSETKSIITQIIITHNHEDHIGGLKDVRRLCGRDIPAYKMDFASPELRRRFAYKDGPIEFIGNKHSFSVEGATLTAHYNPGHADDHMVLWLEEEQAVFSADSILGEGTTVFSNLSQYMNSLSAIKEMNPKVIYPGHGPVVNDPIPHIDYYITHRQEREHQILHLLTLSDQSAVSIVKILYKDYPVAIHEYAASVILLHLDKLKLDAKVRCHGDSGSTETVWTIDNFANAKL